MLATVPQVGMRPPEYPEHAIRRECPFPYSVSPPNWSCGSEITLECYSDAIATFNAEINSAMSLGKTKFCDILSDYDDQVAGAIVIWNHCITTTGQNDYCNLQYEFRLEVSARVFNRNKEETKRTVANKVESAKSHFIDKLNSCCK
jgi:hypothetical protein